LPLSGIRVADFSWVHSGPYGTFHLAQLGAEVIKIEGIQRLDNNRDHVPFADGVPGLNRSGQFAMMNTGKKSVTLEMPRARDRELAKAIVAVSDVVVENMSVGVMPGFGLGYEDLRKVRPDVVMVSCSGFGQEGPLRKFRAYMNTIHGFTGLIDLNGNPDEPPTPLGGNWTDFVAGTAIAFAVMVALHHRDRTGRGQHVDLSMAEALMALMGISFMEYFTNGRVPPRQGNRSSTALQGVYPTGEGRWVAMALETDTQWGALIGLMGSPAWARDSRFRTMAGRLRYQDELDQHINAWTLGHEPHALTTALQEVGIPAGLMANIADLVNDPHMQSRGFFCTVDHPETGRRTHMGLPYHLRADEAGERRPAPCLGEHNEDVLRDLLGAPREVVQELTREASRRVAEFARMHGRAPA